jgi:hypothetical protein
MALVSINIPNLISGVSQQADALRFASQAEESINAYPSLVDGLVKRPNTRYVAKLYSEAFDFVKFHTINRDTSERYTVLFNSGDPDATKKVRVWNMSGVAQTVVTRSNALNYLPTNCAKNIKCLTVADYTVVLNKDKTTAMSTGLSYTRPYEAMVFISQGAYSAEYSVTLDGTKYTVKSGDGSAGTGTVSHGTAPTSPTATTGTWPTKEQANTTKIAEFLAAAIRTNTNYDATGSVIQIGSTIYIKRDNDAAFTIAVSDSQSGNGLKLINEEVQSFLDLPAEGKHDFTVKVAGEPDDEGDEYWVRFEASNGTQGTGIWKETLAPSIPFELNSASMPHALIRLANGKFLFTPLDGGTHTDGALTYDVPYWGERTVGDEESSPNPSFVGRKIADMVFFRNRLGFLCDENVILSEASEFFNFFRTTVTQLLDSDLIDVASSSNKVSILFAGVPFLEKLILFADQTQFSLQSSDNLTSKTVSIQNTTNFSCSSLCPPVSVGKNIYFAFNRDNYSGIQEYYLNSDSQYLDGVDISASIPSYIKGAVTKIVGSDNEQMIAVMSDQFYHGFYLYKYFFNGNEKLQSAWCKFTFGEDPLTAGENDEWAYVENIDFIDNQLFIVVSRTDGTYLERIDFQSGKTDETSNYAVLLDRRLSDGQVTKNYNSATGNTTFTLPYSIDPNRAAVVTRATTLSGPGYVIQTASVGGGGGQLTQTSGVGGSIIPVLSASGTSVVVKGAYASTPLWIGENYTMEHTLGRVVLRAPGAKGNPTVVSAGKLYLRRASVSYDKTRTFKIKVTPINAVLPTTYEYLCNNQVTGTTTSAVNYDSLRDGTFRFPILSKNDQVIIKLVNDTPHPCSLLSMDVEAQYVSRSQRAG